MRTLRISKDLMDTIFKWDPDGKSCSIDERTFVALCMEGRRYMVDAPEVPGASEE